MFKPGGVLWLLAHELRVTWRGFAAAGRARGAAGRIVLYVVIAAALLLGGFGLAQILAEIDPEPTPHVVGILTAVFALLTTFMLAQGITLITDGVYQRGDLDLLLSSPVPPWRVLMVRMGAVVINVATLYLLLTGAVFLWLPFTGGWRWMGFAPSVLALALFATALALVVSRFLFAIMGPRNTRVTAQVVGALTGAAFFLAVQTQNFAPYQQRAQRLLHLVETLGNLLGDLRNPLTIPAQAALGQPIAMVLWFAIAVGAYVLAVWWFASRFIANAAAVAGAGGGKRADTRVRAIQSGLTRTLVRKEWRLLLRDPLLLSQILVQLFYLAPLVFVVWRGIGFEEMDRGRIGLISGAFVLLASTLSASLVWLTVSAEDAPELIAAAPVPRARIEAAKAIAAGTPVAALMLVPAIAACVIDLAAGIWLFIGTVLAIISASLIGIWHQAPGSRKNFRRRAGLSITARLGQSFITLAWAAATGLAVAGIPLLAVIPGLIGLGLLLALHESRARDAAV